MIELNELAYEIFRDINHNKTNKKKILDERIDVELMLNIIDAAYEIEEKEKIKKWKSKKRKIERKYLNE